MYIRSLNSIEPNLFVMRAYINGSDGSLNTPDSNNLPTGFTVSRTGTGSYTITYGTGINFNSIPTINLTPLVSTNNISGHIANIKTISKTTATIKITSQDGTTGADIDLIINISGNVRMGLNGGISNKGWMVNNGNNAEKNYVYMDVGIGETNPHHNVDSMGCLHIGGSLILNPVNPTNAIDLTTCFNQFNTSGGGINATLANGVDGQIIFCHKQDAANTVVINGTNSITGDITFSDVGTVCGFVFVSYINKWVPICPTSSSSPSIA